MAQIIFMTLLSMAVLEKGAFAEAPNSFESMEYVSLSSCPSPASVKMRKPSQTDELLEAAIFANLAYKPEKSSSAQELLKEVAAQKTHYFAVPHEETSGVIVERADGTLVITFKGTTNLGNVVTDINVPWAWDRHINGRVHCGVLWHSRSCEEQIMAHLERTASDRGLSLKELSVQLVGHSLGGGTAQEAAYLLYKKYGVPISRVTTFASPPVFDHVTADHYDEALGKVTTTVSQPNDPVPFAFGTGWLMGAQHVGEQVELLYPKEMCPHKLGTYRNVLEARRWSEQLSESGWNPMKRLPKDEGFLGRARAFVSKLEHEAHRALYSVKSACRSLFSWFTR